MRKLILLLPLLLASCTQEWREEQQRIQDRDAKEFNAPYEECRAHGGIPYTRYRGDGGYIPYYGGCDFPGKERGTK